MRTWKMLINVCSIFGAHTCVNGCASDAGRTAKSYLLEVLLSYRLLFGQEKRSRKLYREKEKLQIRMLGSHDTLLDHLCARKTLPDDSPLRSRLPERGVYSSTIDFPHLGKRLIDLQSYSMDQKPRSLIEVWNDHRDPQQSFTFWAVVIVGGLSISLTLIQTLLVVAQLVFQIRGK